MLFRKWCVTVQTAERALIQPDGCRDLIAVAQPDGRCALLYTDWDRCPREAQLGAGQTLTGYRLRPGCVLPEQAMQDAPQDADQLGAFIASAAARDTEMSDVVQALSEAGASTRTVARGGPRVPCRPVPRWPREPLRQASVISRTCAARSRAALDTRLRRPRRAPAKGLARARRRPVRGSAASGTDGCAAAMGCRNRNQITAAVRLYQCPLGSLDGDAPFPKQHGSTALQ